LVVIEIREGIAVPTTRSTANALLRERVSAVKDKGGLLIDISDDLSPNEFLAVCRAFPDYASECAELFKEHYKTILKIIPDFISVLREPNEFLQLYAVKLKPKVIKDIDIPVDEALKLALAKEPELILEIKSPSEYAMLCVAKSKPKILRSLELEDARRFKSYLAGNTGLPLQLRDSLLKLLV